MNREDYRNIQEAVAREIDSDTDADDEEILECIEEHVLRMGHTVYLSVEEKKELIQRIFYSMRKFDVLQEILEDSEITEIMVNGPDQIFIERNGGIEPYPKTFFSAEKLEDVIQQIVSKANRRVNEANPIVDVRLPDGSRVNVVLPPVAINGPIVTIRKFPKEPISMDKLIELNSISSEAAVFLQTLVRAKYNIFISGGTGSGKTTFLNALSRYIPTEERIITIEDSAELQLQSQPNLVRLEMRSANVEGKNEVSIRELMKSALRMRPDRIILGEVRDAAACELLNVMNTGHDGSLSTGHANSPEDMMNRLETMVLTGMDIPLAAIRNQIASALDIVVQLGRLRDKSRRVLEVDEVIGVREGKVVLRPLFVFRELGDGRDKLEGKLESTGNQLHYTEKLKRAGLHL
ncbi:MAG: CpaF family protein [Lachnospiraceae bacterium]|nr:CpaF family protein [Lachnospiraceae bacterium]